MSISLLNRFKETIKRYKLINKGDKILIGVSGGADSVCLLYLLRALRKELNLSLHIAHLNHMLRGKDACEDADFVSKLAIKLNMPITLKEADVGRYKQKRSLEEAAREIRLHFLFEAARKIKADKIALGHNRDDQAETILMRILRGSGLQGLSGISAKKQMDSFVIIRPLIEIERKDIEAFLKNRKVKPRIDKSNLEEVYFRNRIRRKLLPEIKKYNPNIKEILANTAESVAIDYDYILGNGLKIFEKLKIGKAKSRVKLVLKKFFKLHPSLQNMILRLVFLKLKGDTRRLTYRHIKEIRELIFNRPESAIVDLPSQISVSKDSRYLCVYKRKTL